MMAFWRVVQYFLDLSADWLWVLGEKCIDASLFVGGKAVVVTRRVDPVGVAWREQQLARALDYGDALRGMDGGRFDGTVVAERHMLFHRGQGVSLYAVRRDDGVVFIRTDNEMEPTR